MLSASGYYNYGYASSPVNFGSRFEDTQQFYKHYLRWTSEIST